MKIYLATDHAGFELKEIIKQFLNDEGYEVQDMGNLVEDKSDDYPDYIARAAEAVAENPEDRAIIFGHSGQGEAMVANRFHFVRAAVYTGGGEEVITLSREHNDANVLSIGAHFVKPDEAKELVRLWLDTPFSGEERHMRRIQEIEEVTSSHI